MSYRFIYSRSDAHRVVQAVLIDKRATVAELRNKNGAAIKIFIDTQVGLVTGSDATVFYKIETEKGNLAGYFTLQVVRSGVVSLLQYELRPAFVQFDSVISGEISTFMQSGNWIYDTL